MIKMSVYGVTGRNSNKDAEIGTALRICIGKS